MAFPLKSGADLYNNQLIRAAIWNYSAEILDPKEYVTGLMYFNTNPGSNLYQKLRFRTGTEWKTIAFEEDLDVANNADFQTLKAKVEAFLEGGVDSDGVLNKLSEIQAFLDNYSSATDLTEILDTKLDKRGGTIKNNDEINLLTLDTAQTAGPRFHLACKGVKKATIAHIPLDGWGSMFVNDGVIGLLLGNNGKAYISNDTANFTELRELLHEGNIGKYNAGGLVGQYVTDLNNASANKIFSSGFQAANIPSENYATGLTLYNDELKYTYQLAYNSSGKLYSRYKTSAWSDWKTIAFTDSNVASAQALVHSNGMVGAKIRDNGIVSFNEFIVLKNNKFYMGTLNDGTTERNILGINSSNNLLVGYGSRWDGKTLIYGDGIECIIKDAPAMLINESGNVTIGASDLAGTSAKFAVDGVSVFDVNSAIYGRSIGGNFFIDGKNYTDSFEKGFGVVLNDTSLAKFGFVCSNSALDYMYMGKFTSPWMVIKQSGNVGIGTTANISSLLTLAASTTDEPTIAVDNHCKILGISNQRNDWGSRTILESGWNSTAGDYLYLRLPSSAANSSYLFMQRENGGRFGVDTNAPQAKFHVNGDIVANGTIACKGIAAEGDAMDMVDKVVLHIVPNGTQQTFTLNHGLGTREITICIYEVTSLGTNMILTDVEIVDDNNISVSFGNPPTENHMVVVMG